MSFVRRELRRSPSLAEYRLRASGGVAVIRHPMLDMWVLEEVFGNHAYDFPEPVVSLLQDQRSVRVLDVGAHVGLFGLHVLARLPSAEITSFEPDPRNARVLERCIAANAASDSWHLVEALATTRDGTAPFVSGYHLSRAAPDVADLEPEHESLTRVFPFLQGRELLKPQLTHVVQRDVFPFLDDADLVKLDIQGGEWDILADERFPDVRASAIVLEYHPASCPGDDAEAFLRERLGEAGYTLRPGPTGHDDEATVWAWR